MDDLRKNVSKQVFRKMSVAEQRRRHSARVMVSVGLECHLRNLVREIKSGSVDRLPEFQQMIQYAPPEMKLRLQGR